MIELKDKLGVLDEEIANLKDKSYLNNSGDVVQEERILREREEELENAIQMQKKNIEELREELALKKAEIKQLQTVIGDQDRNNNQ